MPGKQLKKLQLLSPVQNKPSPPSTLPKKHKSISVQEKHTKQDKIRCSHKTIAAD
jgi:hypothetical protein